jgi:hypothetical protein
MTFAWRRFLPFIAAVLLAAAAAQQAEQDKRLALEQSLATSEQTHYRKNVRLSVLLDATDAAKGCKRVSLRRRRGSCSRTSQT